MKKKTTRKKATRKKPARKTSAKKSVKRRRSTTQKSPLMRKIDEYKKVADKALRSAEEMEKKAKASKNASIKRSYAYGAKQMVELAKRAQKKASDLIKKK